MDITDYLSIAGRKRDCSKLSVRGAVVDLFGGSSREESGETVVFTSGGFGIFYICN